AIGRFHKRVECIAGIFGRVFLARESLLLVIADEPYSLFTGGLHERDAGIVHAATGDASEINCRTPIKFGAYRAKALPRECAVKLIGTVAGVNPLQKRQNKPKCCHPKPRVTRSDSNAICTHWLFGSERFVRPIRRGSASADQVIVETGKARRIFDL